MIIDENQLSSTHKILNTSKFETKKINLHTTRLKCLLFKANYIMSFHLYIGFFHVSFFDFILKIILSLIFHDFYTSNNIYLLLHCGHYLIGQF